MDKEQVLFDVFSFRTGILDTPSFIPSLLKEVNVRHVALPMVNKHHCDTLSSATMVTCPQPVFPISRSGFHNGAVCITRAVDSQIP